jgi:hypothetical protein
MIFTETEWNCMNFMQISSLKFDVQVLHIMLPIFCEFYENQRKEGCTFHMNINEVTFICILLNCMMFGNLRKPW